MEWLPIYAIITSALLFVVTIMMFWNRSELGTLKTAMEKMQDKLSHISSGIDKLDTGLDWFLSREGLKIDYCHANWRWLIVSRDDNSNIYRTLKELDRDKREALAKALYEASLQAMRDFNKEQKKEKTK
jgi:hypothetical protein